MAKCRIDLSKYRLGKADKSVCGCGRTMFFLTPRNFKGPQFQLCICGRIYAPGKKGGSVQIARKDE